MKRLVSLTMIMLMLAIVMSGCWDRIEIEQKGFVIGAAIDIQQTEEVEERIEEVAPGKPEGKVRFALTQQFVIPAGISGGGDTGGGTEKAYLNLTSEGDTIFEIVRSVAARISRTPVYDHNELIIISEELAKSPYMRYALDYFIRQPEMRRGTRVMISKDDARDIIEIEQTIESTPVHYIESISKNNFKNSRMQPPSRLGDIHQYLLLDQSFLIQRVVGEKNEVKVAGNAVISGQDNQMVGFLGEEETEGLNFLTGQVKGGLLEINFHGNMVVFEIREANHELVADVSNPERIKFTVTVKTEGVIAEYFNQESLMEGNIIEEIETQVADEIVRLMEDAISKVKDDFNADVLKFGQHLKMYHYDLWQEIKGDWETGRKLFQKVEVELHANTTIRNTGNIDRSYLEGDQ